jgi:hypothetical protein
MVPFSESEEAFLFKNIKNIINVWSSGAGQARLNIFVKNGKAELQLNYCLGHPEESHLPPQLEPQIPPQTSPPLRKRKSQRRQARDNQRAAQYQAGKRAATSSTPNSSALISVLSTKYFSSSSTNSVPVTSSPGLVSQPATPSTTTVTSIINSPVMSAVVIPAASLFDSNATDPTPADLSMVSLDSTIPTTTFTPWTMPERRFVDCSQCDEDIADHVQPLPCYNCGEWFHHDCLPGHECVIRNDVPVTSDVIK